jgi:hypothetical protein
LELHQDPSDFAIEVLTELAQRPLQRSLHLLTLTLADFAEPVVLKVGKKRKKQKEDPNDYERQRQFSFMDPHADLVLVGQLSVKSDSKTRLDTG